MCAEITGAGGRGGASHLCQLVQSDRLLKQAFVLGLESHFTDDGSRVAGKLIYDSRLEGRRGEEITVRADQREEEDLSKRQSGSTSANYKSVPKNSQKSRVKQSQTLNNDILLHF